MQEVSKLEPRAVDSRFHRAEWQTRPARDGFVGFTLDVTQRHEEPPLFREVEQRLWKQGRDCSRAHVGLLLPPVFDFRNIRHRIDGDEVAPPTAADFVASRVGRRRHEEPLHRLGRITAAPQAVKKPEKNVLTEVVRKVLVPHSGESDAPDDGMIAVDEQGKSLAVARECSPAEVSV